MIRASTAKDRARIAVIGGGIAGLTAAYRLGQRHRVTLYERHPTPGLAIHGVQATRDERIDVPLRVFTEGHYHNLLALYAELGVETESIAHSASYSTLDADGDRLETFLRYGVGPENSPAQNVVLSPFGRQLMAEHAGFLERARADLQGGRAAGVTLWGYLRRCGVSPGYARCFVVPSFAGIATCSFETAQGFPADVALELLLSGMTRIGLRRVRGGAARAVERFEARLEDFRGSTEIARVEQRGERVELLERGGRRARFDHVVVATPAPVATRIVALSRQEFAVLADVRSERVRVVVHRDGRLLPEPARRGAFNFVFDGARRAVSASIWVHAVQPAVDEEVYQSVNPLRPPEPSTVLHDIVLERAAVDARGAEVGSRIDALNADRARRIWFCGAYAARGVPLLETGVISANRVAAAIDGEGEALQESA